MSIDIKYKKMSDESYDDYSWRMCLNKDLGVYQLTWEEIGQILNEELDEDFTSSKWRKNYQMMKKGFDKAREQDIDDEGVLDELELKKQELYVQQVKVRDKLREYRATLRDEARIENLQDTFIECANIISKEKPLSLNTYPTPNGDKISVLQISDWHFDEIVNNFLNTYNHEVFNEKINKLTTDTIKYCKLMNVKTLKVLNLNDLITGNIHVTSRVTSEEDAVYQTMYVAEAIANMLVEFAKEISEVEFYSVLDNHSRINQNKKEHIEKESFARFIPWYLKPRLANIKNIKIVQNRINEIEEFDIGVVDIFHEKAFYVHGHNDKVTTVISDLTLMTKIFPIAVFIGHLHQNMEMETHCIDLIMNPSLIGVGEYSKSIRKTSKSRQKLTIFENVNGNVERAGTFFINL